MAGPPSDTASFHRDAGQKTGGKKELREEVDTWAMLGWWCGAGRGRVDARTLELFLLRPIRSGGRVLGTGVLVTCTFSCDGLCTCVCSTWLCV